MATKIKDKNLHDCLGVIPFFVVNQRRIRYMIVENSNIIEE